MSSPYRILYLYPGPTPPPVKEVWDKHLHLSHIAEGDILLPVWWRNEAEQLRAFPEERKQIGNFRYHVYRYFETPRAFRSLRQYFFYVITGRKLCRSEKPYDFIVSYGASITGLAAITLQMFSKAKLIVEISGVPDKAYLYGDSLEKQSAFFRQRFTDWLLRVCLRRTSRIHLLFSAQLEAFPEFLNKPKSVFHEFVPVSSFQPSEVDEKYILFIGHPWFLKGVDVLLDAFRQLSPRHPEYRLKIVGWCTDRVPFERLAEGLPVEFSKGVPYPEALELIRKCSLFVLPSRTEAMGRVLLEAMAIGKPVVASRVDGIPAIIEDGENGLLFAPENPSDLARQIEAVLDDEVLAERLRTNGLRRVREEFNEKAFVSHFEEMFVDAKKETP